MNVDFKEINKEGFQCLQMPDGSVYYGELEYCHTQNGEITYTFDDLPEDQRKNYKIVRHGYGI